MYFCSFSPLFWQPERILELPATFLEMFGGSSTFLEKVGGSSIVVRGSSMFGGYLHRVLTVPVADPEESQRIIVAPVACLRAPAVCFRNIRSMCRESQQRVLGFAHSVFPLFPSACCVSSLDVLPDPSSDRNKFSGISQRVF